VFIVPVGQASFTCAVRVPSEESQEAGWTIAWSLRDESGQTVADDSAGPGLVPANSTFVEETRHVQFNLDISAGFPLGYYDLAIGATAGPTCIQGHALLIMTPSACYTSEAFQDGGHVWGLWTQLYALRSQRNWGFGDFTDLEALVRWAAADLGAEVIGVNPLHALKNRPPHHISPYSPNSRVYLNELYVDVERVPEFHKSPEAQRLVASDEFRSHVEACRKSDRVDYEGVQTAKWAVFEQLFHTFEAMHFIESEGRRRARTGRGESFERYCQAQGESLERFATFVALSEHFQRSLPPIWVWQAWPAEYRHPDSEAVRAFARRHRDRIRLYQYMQWVAEEQLAEISRATVDLGMPVGLYHDLALGNDPSGAEGWLLQDVLAMEADCGCPPDAFAMQGQNWGFPPFNPVALREQAYRPFIRLVRQNLLRGGALRIDHVMGLFRLFWIPRGQPASSGTYVHYPFDDLLGILALESVRTRTVVVGEDLGTVPDWVRERLEAANILSYRVFYFERETDGSWKQPDAYPVRSLAVTTTHDLPTWLGFWTGEDLHIRAKLGLFPTEQSRQQAWEDRERDKARIAEALARASLISESPERLGASRALQAEGLLEPVHRFLARSSSCLVLASLDDWLGEVAQVNLPGTVDQYPNWSRKLTIPLESMRGEHIVRRLAEVMREERPARSSENAKPLTGIDPS
jgi:4-alpha-glucanotransferase